MDIFTFNKTKTGIFTIGRMNPPHPGHMYIIETMIHKAIETNVDEIFVIITATIDIEKNPLICIDKKKLLVDYIIPKIKENMIKNFPKDKEHINNLKVNVFCTENPDILEPNLNNSVPKSFNSVVKNNNLSNVFLIVGKDREDSFKKLFEKNKNIEIIPIVRDDPTQKSGNISATKIREYVKLDNMTKFKEVMETTSIPDNILTKMFLVIQHNLNINKKNQKKILLYDSVFKKSDNSNESINENGKRKRSSQGNNGGKKRNTRKKRNKVFRRKRISCKNPK